LRGRILPGWSARNAGVVMRLLLIGAVALSLLALPAAALAQSAGDDQYSDPLAPSDQPADQGQSQSGSSDQPSATPQPAPSDTAAAPTAPTSPTSETAAAPAANTLPRTGWAPGALVATAAALLLGGLMLRRSSSVT
jgi:hypothetical protein